MLKILCVVYVIFTTIPLDAVACGSTRTVLEPPTVNSMPSLNPDHSRKFNILVTANDGGPVNQFRLNQDGSHTRIMGPREANALVRLASQRVSQRLGLEIASYPSFSTVEDQSTRLEVTDLGGNQEEFPLEINPSQSIESESSSSQEFG